MNQAANNQTPESCIASGTIAVSLPNLEALDGVDGKPKPITSTIHEIGGMKWRMEVHKVMGVNNKLNKLNMHIFCNEEVKDHLWLCKIHFTMKKGYGDNVTSYNHYGFNNHFWIFPIEQYISWPINITLDVKICYTQQSFPPLDTTLVVNMGEGHSETLLVNKNILASISNYFRNLFFEDWRDKEEQEGTAFELNETEDFDIRAFKAMIYSAMAMGFMVRESNFLDYALAAEIVKLAIKYQVPMLLEYCEKFLITIDAQKMASLELADQFNLVLLKRRCMDQMSVLDLMEDFSKVTGVHSRLSKATREQLQQKLGGKAEELRELTMNLQTNLEYNARMKSQSSALIRPYNKLAKVVFGKNVEEVKYTN